jgi:hypothetical protein
MMNRDGDLSVCRTLSLARRDFLGCCVGTTATAVAVEDPKRPRVIWLSGQECTGCTPSMWLAPLSGVAERGLSLEPAPVVVGNNVCAPRDGSPSSAPSPKGQEGFSS